MQKVKSRSRNLTDVKIERAPIKGVAYELKDSREPNLSIHVTPSGSKRFRLRCYVGMSEHRQQKRFSLGKFPDLTIEEAREKAREYLKLLSEGVDPTKKHLGNISTYDAAERYFSHSPIKSSKAREQLFERHIFPELGAIALADLTRPLVADFLSHKQKEGLTTQANRIQSQIKALISWACDQGYIEADPVAGMKKVFRGEVPRDRTLKEKEIHQVWAACEQLGYPRGDAVKMLLLTGCRLREMGELSWKEVDFGSDRITIPGIRMKNKETHEIPVTVTMKNILLKIGSDWGTEGFVFSTTGGDRAYSGWSKAKVRFDIIASLETPWAFHDTRRTVRTLLAELGISRDVGERVLAHKTSKLEQVYDRHSYREQKKNALDALDQRLSEIVSGVAVEGNVVRLSKT